jgi:hypothetical protein
LHCSSPTHEHHRSVPIHPAPGGQWADLAALRNRVLAQGVLSAELHRHGRAGLPFAYLHFRSGGITSYVFGGVLVGISFFLLNNVFGYIGNLQNWLPWLTAAAPGLIYSMFSLGAFGWLVLKR